MNSKENEIKQSFIDEAQYQKRCGNIIKNGRLEKKMTQSQLADACGTSDKTISKFENGLATPSAYMLDKMLVILEIPRTTFDKLCYDRVPFPNETELLDSPSHIEHLYLDLRKANVSKQFCQLIKSLMKIIEGGKL